MAEVAVAAGVVEAVADDEPVVNREADIVNLHVDLTPRRLAQQAGGCEREGFARAQHVLQTPQRRPAVDDILDDDDALALDRRIQIVQEPDLARGRGTLRVARRGDEVEREIAGDMPDQVREKDEGPFENRHQMKFVRVVAAELQGQLCDAFLNLVLGE